MKKYILILGIIALGFGLTVNAQTFVFSNDLSLGATGNDVTALQTWLISNGYDIPAVSSGMASKGYFGAQTKTALIRYQNFVGLPGTGYFGPLTRGKLNGGGTSASFTLLSPNGNENWIRGTTQVISWNGSPETLNHSARILLVPPPPPCSIQRDPSQPVCMPALAAPYQIANVSLSSRSYVWKVGDYVTYGGPNSVVPDGNYRIQICTTDSYVCVGSAKEFTITSAADNRAPVINSLVAPTALNPQQVGVWIVKATDPQSSSLYYSVDWGDVIYPVAAACPAGYACLPTATAPAVQQGSTFTHSYSSPGVYTVKFTVRNNAGLSAVSTATVNVSGQGSGIPTVTSPNGGEKLQANTTQAIRWNTYSIDPNTKLDMYLDPLITSFYCVPNQPCPAMPYRPSYVLDRNVSVSTVYNWIVATDINNADIVAGDYKVRLCLVGSTTSCDSSDGFFTILR